MGLFGSMGTRAKQSLLRARLRWVTGSAWRRRHRKVFTMHPEYARPAPPAVEREHLRMWRRLRRSFRLDTLRICHNTAGEAPPEIVPEEVFASEVEPALNRYDECLLLGNKALCDVWLPPGSAPHAFLRNVDGAFLDGELHALKPAQVRLVLDSLVFPLVLKPAVGKGGIDVSMVESRQELDALIRDRQDYVVQERVQGHPFFRRFNDYGLNTVRVCTYRSVATERVHVLNAALRMGRTGKLDNLTQGGVAVPVHEDGRLHHYAVDLYGAKYSEHPDSHVDFTAGECIPQFEGMCELAVRVAERAPLARMLSLDVCLDAAGRWRVIEVNVRHQTVRMFQCAGRAFFGRFTREVIDHCRRNPRWPLY